MFIKIMIEIFSFFSGFEIFASDVMEKSGSLSFDISLALKEFPIVLSITGYVVVFLALVILISFVLITSKILTSKQRKRLREQNKECSEQKDLHIPGDVNAAIAMALHLYFEEIHDEEDPVLTILMQKKAYKPWSSKLYNMTQQPVKQIRTRV
jgi:Na+-transporting methylmalonyl-CoA/oxaloacetate decarboxylase gamma subunit